MKIGGKHWIQMKSAKCNQPGSNTCHEGWQKALKKINSQNTLPGIELRPRKVQKNIKLNPQKHTPGSNPNVLGQEALGAKTHHFGHEALACCRRRRAAVTTVFSGRTGGGDPIFFPNFCKLYTVGKLLQRWSQIYNPNLLILSRFSGSKRNLIMCKTLNQPYVFIFHPFSNPNTSACSGMQDLRIYHKKLAKKRGRNFTYLKWQWWKSRVQVLKLSRCAPIILLWSFVQEIVVEGTWI
jgi:hypothetical protein